ncbi:MAG TPA: serine hydrolase, partial [candidate division Zixibacteria bacterium]|nr:serine hydrolase [candidate division Zixibacteria bacterium]
MKLNLNRLITLLLTTLILSVPAAFATQPFSSDQLVGLWSAERIFGPEVKGELTIESGNDSATASINGYDVTVAVKDSRISFDLPYDLGSFRGQINQGMLRGYWIQPRTIQSGVTYATPVEFTESTSGRWVGNVRPMQDVMTFFMPVTIDSTGELRTYLVNPERNVGKYIGVQSMTCDGENINLLGPTSRNDSTQQVLLGGTYDAYDTVISVYMPGAGGSFDFHPAPAAEMAKFSPRGISSDKFVYFPPPVEDDGWEVGSVDDVGISRDSISNFVKMLIDMPTKSVHSPRIDGFLLARHGKLVVEEYFHGFHRTALHDTRSASKSLTSLMVGAAIEKGYPVSLKTPVYETLYGPSEANSVDPRKAAITVRNLLTMSSGLDCDDSDPNSKGGEDIMQEQSAQPDWYRYTLEQKMVRAPGEKAVYGSANANLLGGLLAKTTAAWLPDLFRDLIADPLQIHDYAMNLTPTGDAYMGGGVRFRPRDFMKIGQVILDSGKWHGKQIIGSDWAEQSVQPLYDLEGVKYGYLWWIVDYPYKNG